MTNLPLICVTGATASGKSSLSIALAKKLDGEVVCVDAVQVYRFADIGSAKVSVEERQGIPHHCLDIANPDQQLDASEVGDAARNAIIDIQSRGKVPIVCIGSTMYFQSLLYGLVPTAPKDETLRSELKKVSSVELHQRLVVADPAKAAALHPNDTARIIRALEVAAYEKQGLSGLQQSHGFREPLFTTKTFFICWPREELYQRITRRTEQMIAAGLVAEADNILTQFGAESPLFRSIGYSQAKEFLGGKLSEQELFLSVAQATRNYAKRQLTFWKNEPRKRSVMIYPEQPVTKIVMQDPAPAHLSIEAIVEVSKRKDDATQYFISYPTS